MGSAIDKYLAANPVAPAAPADETIGESFSKGLRSGGTRFIGDMQGLVGGVGAALGADDFARQQYANAHANELLAQSQAPAINDYRQIDGLRSGAKFLAGQAGQMAPAIGAGVLGAVAMPAAVPLAGLAGATLATAPQMIGAEMQAINNNPDAAQTGAGEKLAMGTGQGLAKAALMNAVPQFMGGKLLHGAPAAQGLGRSIATNLGEAVAGNAAAGAGSELVTQAGENHFNSNRDTTQDADNVKHAAITGGIVGAPFGALGIAGGQMGRARTMFKKAGDAVGDVAERAGNMIGGARDAAVDLGERAAAKTGELGGQVLDAAGPALDTAGQALDSGMTSAKSVAKSAAGKLGEMLTREKDPAVDIAAGDIDGVKTIDPEAYATAAPDAQEAMVEGAKQNRFEQIKQMAAELYQDKALSPESKARLDAMQGDFTSATNSMSVAGMSLARKAGKAAGQAVEDLGGHIDKLVEGWKNKPDETKSEFSPEVTGIIRDTVVPFLRQHNPALLEDPAAVAKLGDTMRSVLALAADGKLDDGAVERLQTVFGGAASRIMKSVADSLNLEDAKTLRRINQIGMAEVAGADGARFLEKQLGRDAMTQMDLTRSDLTRLDNMIQSHVDQSAYRNMGGDARAIESRNFESTLRESLGDEQATKLLDAYAKRGATTKPSSMDDRAPMEDNGARRSSDDLNDSDAFDNGMTSGENLSDKFDEPRFFGKGKDHELVDTVEAHQRKYGATQSPGERILETARRTEGRDRSSVEFVPFAELPRDIRQQHLDRIQATKGELVKTGMPEEEALQRAVDKHGAPNDVGMVRSEGMKQEGRMSAEELDSVRVDTSKTSHRNDPSRIDTGVQGAVIDAQKLVRLYQPESKTPFNASDDKGAMHRLARVFMEGVAATQDHLGKAFEIPDETVVKRGKNGGRDITWGELKKLDMLPADEGKAADEMSAWMHDASAHELRQAAQRHMKTIDEYEAQVRERINQAKEAGIRLTKSNVRDMYQELRTPEVVDANNSLYRIGKALDARGDDTLVSKVDKYGLQQEIDPNGNGLVARLAAGVFKEDAFTGKGKPAELTKAEQALVVRKDMTGDTISYTKARDHEGDVGRNGARIDGVLEAMAASKNAVTAALAKKAKALDAYLDERFAAGDKSIISDRNRFGAEVVNAKKFSELAGVINALTEKYKGKMEATRPKPETKDEGSQFGGSKLKKPETLVERALAGDRVGHDFIESLRLKYAPDMKLESSDNADMGTVHGQADMMKDGSYKIRINPDLDPLSRASVMAHEFGHTLQWHLFDTAPAETRKTIFSEYYALTKKYKDNPTMTAEQFIKDFDIPAGLFNDKVRERVGSGMSAAEFIKLTDTDIEAAGGPRGYSLSFDEYFANQFSKYVSSGAGKEMPAHVRSFWGKVEAVFKQFYDEVVKKFTPQTEFAKWVESIAQPEAPRSKFAEAVLAGGKSTDKVLARVEASTDAKGMVGALRELLAASDGNEHSERVIKAMNDRIGRLAHDNPDVAFELMQKARSDAGKMYSLVSGRQKRGYYVDEENGRFTIHDDATGEETLLHAEDHPNADEFDMHGYPSRAVAERMIKEYNGADFSLQTPGAKASTVAEQKAVAQHIGERLGPDVEVAFKALLHAGDYERVKNAAGRSIDMINLSMHALDPMSVGAHETLHGFIQHMREADLHGVNSALYKAADSIVTKGKLEKLLANEPAALEQIRGAAGTEERAAYMYQFWSTRDPVTGARMLEVGDGAKTVFQKISDFIHKTLGLWTADERATQIMEYLHSGEYAKTGLGDRSAVQRAVLERGTNATYEAIKKQLAPLSRMADSVVGGGDAVLKDMRNPAIDKIRHLILAGTSDQAKDVGWIPAQRIERTAVLNKFLEDTANMHLTAEDMRGALEQLQTGVKASSVNARLLAREGGPVRKMLDDLHAYMTEAGVDVKDLGVGKGYFPVVYDTSYIASHQKAWRAMLEKYVRRGDLTAQAADEVTYKLINDEGVAFGVQSGKPGMQFAKERKLAFIEPADRAHFQQKDMLTTLNSYVNQATRRAEWARRMGDDGMKLNDLKIEAVKKHGATPEQMRTVDKYLQGVDGTLGDDIDPNTRRLFGNAIVYQNVRLLPMAVFSMAVDPAGIVVRGGTVRDAFTAFKQGIKEVKRGFEKNPKDDERYALAKTIGVIDDAALMHALGSSYSQGMVGDTGRKINDTFFKYNLVEQMNTSMRVAAVPAALGFIGRHADGTNSVHSARWMAELGLEPKDVVMGKDGPLVTQAQFKAHGMSDEAATAAALKMRGAINKWVDGAILRPNAAHKTMWMNDPHFALVSHLKQFVYSFNETILKRVANEAKYGNYTPAVALASYVPIMMAADFAKGALLAGGGQPAYKDSWDMMDYLSNGWQRAGLNGIGQFGVDAYKDIKFGGIGAGALAGPMLEQAGDGLQALGGRHSVSSFVSDALPVATVAKAIGHVGESKGDPVWSE